MILLLDQTGHFTCSEKRTFLGSSSHLVNHGWHFAGGAERVRSWTGSGGLRFMPMERRTLVPDAGEVALDQLMVESDTRLVMVLRATGEASHCPECRQESRRIHSRYRRRLSDLPWEGLPVRIELRVRRFFCDSEDCGQQIFTERLPKTVQRYSRRTCRLSAFSPADYERVGRIGRVSACEAARHPDQRFDTPSSVAPQADKAIRSRAPGAGY